MNKSRIKKLNNRTNKLRRKFLKMFKSNSSKLLHQNSKESNALPPTPLTTANTNLPVKKGYITKLKSKKRRFFVLYAENDNQAAHLDYYENEKKFLTSPHAFKRSIQLNDCFAVIKKYDPRFKKSNIFVFAIYTRDDCFSLMFDDQDEMNRWFSLTNEIHSKSVAKNRINSTHDYGKILFK